VLAALVLGSVVGAVWFAQRHDGATARRIAISSAFWLTAFFSPLGGWTNLIARAPAVVGLPNFDVPAPVRRNVTFEQ
jgi:hypothetical protein